MKFEPFKETQEVRNFSCGIRELDEFLTTDQVKRYERDDLGRTTLVFYEGTLVAYFTISNAGIYTEYLKKAKSFSIDPKIKIDMIPAVKIGRLAVQTGRQNCGIGRFLIAYIARIALKRGAPAARLLILEAKPNSVNFYTGIGFEFALETRRTRGRINRTMFMDLRKLVSVLPEVDSA